jgi:hypothetical protein
MWYDELLTVTRCDTSEHVVVQRPGGSLVGVLETVANDAGYDFRKIQITEKQVQQLLRSI